MMNLARAEQLLQQGRYDLAEIELRKYLANNIDDSEAHAYLGLCLLNLKKNTEASKEIKASIALNPDFSFSHYLLSKLYIDEDEYKKAEDSIKEALRLEPGEAEYYETLSIIYFNQSEYAQSLEAAEAGLEMDPEHVGCLNIRARNLIKLDRKEYANESFAASFNKDPDNSYTHANQGWALLEQKKYKEALEHFREALRLDPNNDFAKSGLVEALKANYFLYKWFLQFMFWADSLSPRVRWFMLIGFIIVNQIFRVLAPFYLAFVLFTWFLDVIFNTLLRFNKYGRHALNKDQKMSSNFFLFLVISSISSIAGYYLTGVLGLQSLSIACVGMLFPVSGTFRQSNKKSRKKSLYYTYALAFVALVFVIVSFLKLQVSSDLLTLFIIGVIGYTWFVNTFR